MDTPLAFSRWLKQLRSAQELTQEALAERVGCSTEMIRAIEGGRRRPSRAMVERFVEVVQLPVAQHAAFLAAARTSVVAAPEADQLPAPSTNSRQSAQLQVPPTTLLGRATEVAEVRRLLTSPTTRLVSGI